MKGLVYIQGPSYYQPTANVFRRGGYEITTNLHDSDVVVLTGGQDINPAIYKQRPIPGTYFTADRDQVDQRAVELGLKDGKFMVGICRGAQLINCYNGGTLWQDVDRHHGTHAVLDLVSKKQWGSILSVHHQMMRPGPGGEVVGVSYESTYKADDKGKISSAGEDRHGDPEVVWYASSKSLCFQSHPEFGHPETTKFFWELMDRYYTSNLNQG